MTEDEWQVIDNRRDTQWFCPMLCLRTHFNPNGTLKIHETDVLLHQKIESITNDLDRQSKLLETIKIPDIQEQINALERKFNDCLLNMENDIPTKLHEKIEASNSWAEIVKKTKNNMESPPICLEQVKQAITEVTAKDKEMHMRDRGVVIYRVTEKVDLQQEQRKKDDEDFLRELLHYMDCDDLVKDITHMERLGKFDTDKCKDEKYRPIKLRFNLKDKRDKMLSNLTRLKYAPNHIKRVSIRHDLNEAQRQDWYSKIKEAKERTLASNDMIYRVRGHPGNYSVTGFAKNRT